MEGGTPELPPGDPDGMSWQPSGVSAGSSLPTAPTIAAHEAASASAATEMLAMWEQMEALALRAPASAVRQLSLRMYALSGASLYLESSPGMVKRKAISPAVRQRSLPLHGSRSGGLVRSQNARNCRGTNHRMESSRVRQPNR